MWKVVSLILLGVLSVFAQTNCPEQYGVQTYPDEKYCDKFYLVSYIDKRQTLANNSTPPRFLKNIWYSGIIRGRTVGQIVAQYSTRPRVEYL